MNGTDPTWKPGDVANGHVLTEHGWVPLPHQPTYVPMPQWQLALLIGIPGLLFLLGLLRIAFSQ